MLAALPNIGDRNFFVGHLIPAAVGAFILAWLFPDLTLLAPLRNLNLTFEKLDELVYVAIFILIVAGTLMMLNLTLYRILEGYVFPLSKLRFLRERHIGRFSRISEELVALKTRSALNESELKRLVRLSHELSQFYPPDKSYILPSKFGNAIRAFELYSKTTYGADSIPVWIRLASVLPKEYIAHIDSSRANVDAQVNLFFIFSVLAFASLLDAAFSAPWGGSWRHLSSYTEAASSAAAAGTLVFFAFVAYRGAISSALTWGEFVKSAFDCYLGSLCQKLGFEVPETAASRKLFWEDFSRMALYGVPMDDWPVTKSQPKDKESG